MPVAAATFGSSVTQTVCSGTGGSLGHGHTQGHAFMIEHGQSGTNYLRLVADLQRFQNGAWTNVFHKSFSTAAFADNSVNNFTQRTVKFIFITQDAGHKMRTRYEFQFWDQRAGPDHLLHRTVRFGPSCRAS
jgi:hypothetical protein